MKTVNGSKWKEYGKNFRWVLSFYDSSIVFLYCVIVLATVMCELLIPVEIGTIIQGVLSKLDRSLMMQTILQIMGLAGASVLFWSLTNFLRIRVKEEPVYRMQKYTLKRLFELGIPFFEKREKENSFFIYSSMIPMIQEMVQKHIPDLIKNLITVLVSFAFFLKYGGWNCIFVVFAMTPSLLIHNHFNKKIALMMNKQIEKHKEFQSTVKNSIQAMKEIRNYHSEDWIQGKVSNQSNEYVEKRLATLNVRYQRGMFFRLNTALGITLYFLMATYGFYRGWFQIDRFVASISMCITLIYTLNGLVFNVTETIPALEYVKALCSILDINSKKEAQKEKVQNKEIEPLQHEIRIHVNRFFYEKESPILQNVDLTIKKGQKILLVGESGVGKTTLLKLIANLYSSKEVEVWWDKIAYDEIYPHLLREKVGVMFQETYLFANSIFENIKMGNPKADDEEVYEAAKKSCVDDFAKTFPMGYDTNVLEKGTLLSGGQRQRIAIARLILKNPDVILLDEITANLDNQTEKMILDQIFYDVFRSKTIIAVSHKTTVLNYFDRFFCVRQTSIEEVSKDVAIRFV